MHNAADALQQALQQAGYPSGWEIHASYLHNFVSACVGKWAKDFKDFVPGQSGNVIRIFEQLRNERNPVRHASRTLQSPRDVPHSYRKAAKNTHDLLSELYRDFWQSRHVPILVKILSCSEDCFGGLEFVVSVERERMVPVRFISREMLNKLGVVKNLSDLLAFILRAGQDETFEDFW